MAILTVILVAMFLAAWKAPKYVKEIGLIALVMGLLFQLIGFYHALSILSVAGDIDTSVLTAGIRISLINPIYGMIIYVVSLILRMLLKTRK